MCFEHFIFTLPPALPKSILPSYSPNFVSSSPPPITHQFQFVLLIDSWVLSICRSIVNLPGAMPLKNTDSPSPKSHQVSTASQLGVGALNPLPFHVRML